MNFHCWLMQAVSRLAKSESPRRDAEILLGHVSGQSRTFILAFGETPLSHPQSQQLEALLRRRIDGEPIAYLVALREFWSLPLRVTPATLIPRPDTECLVEQALARMAAEPCAVLDLGTGSGAIALAIAHERPDCSVTGLDFLPEAVALAQENAQNLGIKNVTFLQSDWFSALRSQKFWLIVSNPPYIASNDPHLAQGDVRFEPRSALVAGNQGLADLETLVGGAKEFLLPGGWLVLEHGWQQAAAVRGLFRAAGWVEVESYQDYGGNDRLTLGRFL